MFYFSVYKNYFHFVVLINKLFNNIRSILIVKWFLLNERMKKKKRKNDFLKNE